MEGIDIFIRGVLIGIGFSLWHIFISVNIFKWIGTSIYVIILTMTLYATIFGTGGESAFLATSGLFISFAVVLSIFDQNRMSKIRCLAFQVTKPLLKKAILSMIVSLIGSYFAVQLGVTEEVNLFQVSVGGAILFSVSLFANV